MILGELMSNNSSINFPHSFAGVEQSRISSPPPTAAKAVLTATATRKDGSSGHDADKKLSSDLPRPRFPSICHLVSNPDWQETTLLILECIRDTGAFHEPKADNDCSKDSNRWVKLYLCLFEPHQGLLRCVERPNKVGDLKKKIIQLWDAIDANQKFPEEGRSEAKKQKDAYEKAVKDSERMRQENALKEEEMKAKLVKREAALGLIPPGARGVVGGGRAQNSTNLFLNEPAIAAFTTRKYRQPTKRSIGKAVDLTGNASEKTASLAACIFLS